MSRSIVPQGTWPLPVQTDHPVLRLTVAAVVVLMVGLASPTAVVADEVPARNACGCQQDSAGICSCDRGARCGCPGECEPKGCAEKREKQLQKEVEFETKKAKSEMGEHPTSAPKSAAPAGPPVGQPRKREAQHHLTPKDIRELGRLLQAYLEEHPADRDETLEATRAKLTR